MNKEIQFSVIITFIEKEKWVKIGEKERHIKRFTYVYELQLLLLIFTGYKPIPRPCKMGTLIKALIKKKNISPEVVNAEEGLDLVESGVRGGGYTAFSILMAQRKKSCQLQNISYLLHAEWFLQVLVIVSFTSFVRLLLRSSIFVTSSVAVVFLHHF